MDIGRLSKIISLALRHDPSKYNLRLSEEGWVKVEDLLKGIRLNESDFSNIEVDDIYSVMNSSDDGKLRHEIKDGLIRAMYGHSIFVKKEIISVPPKYLYHGTALSYVSKIMLDGLKKMGRQFVHLSESIESAGNVAKKKFDSMVILKVCSQQAHEKGVRFYSEGSVWLCEEIPSIYIRALIH